MSVKFENVSFSYDDEKHPKVLDNISFEIQDGEFVALMGRTGCGKTTVLQLIAGLMRPSEGRILHDDEDINDKKYDRSELRKKVGIVFQYPEYQLFESTVKKDVQFGLKQSGFSACDKEKKAKAALETMGFDYSEIKDKSPLSLSGGEKRRVAVAGVIAAEPHTLIFDEPIAGLDPIARDAFLKMISQQNKRGVTVIMVSHNCDAVCKAARRVIVMKNGKICLDGTVKEVFSDTERLRHAGIGASSCGSICECLSKRGIAIRKDIVQYGEFIEELKNYYKGRG